MAQQPSPQLPLPLHIFLPHIGAMLVHSVPGERGQKRRRSWRARRPEEEAKRLPAVHHHALPPAYHYSHRWTEPGERCGGQRTVWRVGGPRQGLGLQQHLPYLAGLPTPLTRLRQSNWLVQDFLLCAQFLCTILPCLHIHSQAIALCVQCYMHCVDAFPSVFDPRIRRGTAFEV